MPAFITELRQSGPTPLPLTTAYNARNGPIEELHDGLFVQRMAGDGVQEVVDKSRVSGLSRRFRQTPALQSTENCEYDFKTDRLNQDLRLQPVTRNKPPFYRLQNVTPPIDTSRRWCELAKQQFGRAEITPAGRRSSSIAITRTKLFRKQSITSELMKQRFDGELCCIRYQFKK